MNVVVLTGRLTKDADIHTGNTTTARFSLAVDRRFKRDGEQTADFPTCVAFGKTAEWIEKWTHKGTKIEVRGRLQTGSYTKQDGTKVYTTDVIVEEANFAESKNSQSNDQPKQESKPESKADPIDGFMNIPDGIDEELPFGGEETPFV